MKKSDKHIVLLGGDKPDTKLVDTLLPNDQHIPIISPFDLDKQIKNDLFEHKSEFRDADITIPTIENFYQNGRLGMFFNKNKFDFKEHKEIIYSSNYFCPKCHLESQSDSIEEPYIVDNESYPKIYNNKYIDSDMGTQISWDEVHCCPKCKTQFYFNNGN